MAVVYPTHLESVDGTFFKNATTVVARVKLSVSTLEYLLRTGINFEGNFLKFKQGDITRSPCRRRYVLQRNVTGAREEENNRRRKWMKTE
jgi:hypothetical protein